jgi:hypothetical protein
MVEVYQQMVDVDGDTTTGPGAAGAGVRRAARGRISGAFVKASREFRLPLLPEARRADDQDSPHRVPRVQLLADDRRLDRLAEADFVRAQDARDGRVEELQDRSGEWKAPRGT